MLAWRDGEVEGACPSPTHDSRAVITQAKELGSRERGNAPKDAELLDDDVAKEYLSVGWEENRDASKAKWRKEVGGDNGEAYGPVVTGGGR